MNLEDIEEPIKVIFLTKETIFYVYKKIAFEHYISETEPYARDGSYPLVFLRLAFFEIQFTSHRLYNFLYKRKNGYLPEVTKSEA